MLSENVDYNSNYNAERMVIQFVIDHGVANKSHRKNIFNPNMKVFGAAVGDHAKFGTMVCQFFAGGFNPVANQPTPKVPKLTASSLIILL